FPRLRHGGPARRAGAVRRRTRSGCWRAGRHRTAGALVAAPRRAGQAARVPAAATAGAPPAGGRWRRAGAGTGHRPRSGPARRATRHGAAAAVPRAALALRGPPPDAAGGGRVARSGASRARAAPGHAVGLAYRAQAPLSRWPSHGNGDPVPVRARHQAPDVRLFTLERAPRVPIWDHVRPPAILPETPLAPIDAHTARVLLPDVANDARPVHAGALDWVGMGDIEVPVLLAGEDGVPVRTPAR